MIINVKAKEERVELKSGDIVEMSRTGMIYNQFYIVTGANYLINLRCGSHRYKDKCHNKEELLRRIMDDSNATLVNIYNGDKWSLDLIEKGTK
ncbi:hypothetical protein [Bacillus cereus]|uniref:Phage protein n=1 Tax=Bacillus cereus TIAC219 TaxID=718222 RepID=A0ABC9SQJ5_BACCE|nr:hypothetical protein [Bacillus cereus]EJP81140.1 hypothetical protein IC1_06628 [Bacillus cereus VD022]EOQ57831.1 hypothetical protein IAY_06255 [Bacillus cereus TIAC219]